MSEMITDFFTEEQTKINEKPSHTFSVAPMLDWTNRHCRYFHRLLTKNALLYTEMVTTGALLYANPERFLSFDYFEKPLSCQLGGSDPVALARCAKIIEDYGYDEVNLNVGCPSDRVQKGRFGACLMTEPALVADCIASMQAKVSIPVTVKTRIGVDEQDSYAEFLQFISTVAEAGCQRFIVHARKAWLKGLSPKQNRDVPPLHYDFVLRLKQERPDLTIILNGGLTSWTQITDMISKVDGVMVGREAYHNPYFLAAVDQQCFNVPTSIQSRGEIVQALLPYINHQLAQGVRLHSITRHILGLFQGIPGARQWRRILSEQAPKPGADGQVILEALTQIGL